MRQIAIRFKRDADIHEADVTICHRCCCLVLLIEPNGSQ